MQYDSFQDYIKEIEPNKREKGTAWNIAIGLQAVDGLQPSRYLVDTAIRNIEGHISLEEANALVESYYESIPHRNDSDRTEEADKVSARIAKLLSEPAFTLTPTEYISIHRRLFSGIYSHAGRIREYNITKKEWVLDGATVQYGSASELMATLQYDISEERKFSYKNLSIEEMMQHFAIFISRLWQIHVFGEGNTRTTAVFFIKYLRTLGFDVSNDIFANHAWYFRNALVRANYNDFTQGIHETTEYLELFLRNLLLNEHNILQNRLLHIGHTFKPLKVTDGLDDSYSPKPVMWKRSTLLDSESEKVNIRHRKVNIASGKVNIGLGEGNCHSPKFSNSDSTESTLSRIVMEHIKTLQTEIPTNAVFGRADVLRILNLKPTRGSALIKIMLTHGFIEPVIGQGKGRYVFVKDILITTI